jgi:hypothetical protein
MAAWTSQRTGNWSDDAGNGTSPWHGGSNPASGVPGSGDSVTIATTHTVTVDVNTTVGTSPADATTMVLTINSPTGKVIIATAVTLTVNGNVLANAGATNNIQHGIEWNAGSQLVFGSNTNNWVLQGGVFNVFYARGANGNNAILTGPNTTSGRPCCTQTGSNTGPGWDCQYMTLQYLGKTGTPAIKCYLNVVASSANVFSFDHCTFDNMWQILESDLGTNVTMSVTNCLFTNSLYAGPSNLSLSIIGKAGQTGTHVFQSNILDSTWLASFNTPANLTIGGTSPSQGNYFGCNISITVGSAPWPDNRPVLNQNNLIRQVSSNPHVDGSCYWNYILLDADNTNAGVWVGESLGGNTTLDSCILDLTCNAASGGDMVRVYSDGKTTLITAMASNGGPNLIRVTATGHGLNTGDNVYICATLGTIEANNLSRSKPTWTVTVIDANTFDLVGSTFTNTWSSNSFNYVARMVYHLAVTGTANNGSGLIRITTATHLFSTGDVVTLGSVGGTTEADGAWTITVISTTTFDLQGSTFTHAWTSGGTVDRPVTSYTVKNFVVVPSSYGSVIGKWSSSWGNLAYANLHFTHNTYVNSSAGSTDASLVELGVGVGESAVGAPNQIVEFKSNLSWTPKQTGSPAGMPNDPNANPGVLLLRWNAPNVQDYAYAENCDYNWGYNLHTEDSLYGYHRVSGYRTTHFFSSGTPDANGANGNATYQGDPQFVDTSRNMATYDTAKLGTSASQGGWLTSTAYAVGDTVSLATAAVYFGATVNYRCIVAHTSGSTTKPAVGASWRTNWEWNSLAQLRADLTRISDLITWVRAGYAPQNSETATAGHDGATVGAVAWVSAGGGLFFFQRRLSGGFTEMG